MGDEIVRAFEADIASIPIARVSGDDEGERIMKLMAHMFLRVWTRFAVETGQKLTMTPFQYSLGMYHGQMNWAVNEALNFSELPQIELGAAYGRKHVLLAERYKAKEEPRIRLVFSLEEDEEVKGNPVSVNYLLYDSSLKGFKFESAREALKAAVPKWFETVMTRTDAPLWGYCKDNLECVGV
ncbi:MAG: hypothetical protein QG582_1198 [Candidatus Thermoplasmatota archaeon]|nr:hypothetical protein [Candidatus Thermoplasmatota archaeon]